MSSLERLGDSAAAARLVGRIAEQSQRGVVAIAPVVSIPEALETLDLSEIRTRPIDWLWRGYIPLRKVTILDGDPGLGKSTLVIDIASRGSIGGLAPTGEPWATPSPRSTSRSKMIQRTRSCPESSRPAATRHASSWCASWSSPTRSIGSKSLRRTFGLASSSSTRSWLTSGTG